MTIYSRALVFAIGVCMMLGGLWMFWRLGKAGDEGFLKTMGVGISKIFAFFFFLVSIVVTASAFY